MTGGRTITDEQHDGTQGETFARLLVEEMGHEYHPTGRDEAGIDAFIELRDRSSGNVDAQIIACQVKTGDRSFFDQSDAGFSWRAEPGDLTYWETSNLPVVLIFVARNDRRAWWRPVDLAFPDEEARASRVVRVDKVRDNLDGAPSNAFAAVVQRDRMRRRAATEMILSGPLAHVGLQADVAHAKRSEEEGSWHDAAEAWQRIAAAAGERGLDRRIVWPALQSAASALERAGARPAAGELWIRIARERLDDDDASCGYFVHRALWTGAWTRSPDQQLLAIRSSLPEVGWEALDDLRAVLVRSRRARDKQAAAAALVDALAFFGEFEEARDTADEVLGVRHDTPHKRQLALDRLDCAGVLGDDDAPGWARLISDWRDRGPTLHGRVLQRHAIHKLRLGDTAAAAERFQQASEVWAATDGAEEQVAEVAFSAGMVDELAGVSSLNGVREDVRAAGAIARGSIRTPAVRSDRLIQAASTHAVDADLPDALARLVMAAMLDRRAGNLQSWRLACHLLARTYERADEPKEALRMYLLIGDNSRAKEVSRVIDGAAVLRLVRLESGPKWQRSAGFSALEPHAPRLRATEVRSIARSTLEAASEEPSMLAANPASRARRVLSMVAARLPARYGSWAGLILSEELGAGGYNAGEASAGLLALTQRNLFDGLPNIVEAIVEGISLPITVAGALRDAKTEELRPLVEAALDGNVAVLSELARADIPRSSPELRHRCEEVIAASVGHHDESDAGTLGTSFDDQGPLARHASPQAQLRWVALIVAVVLDETVDEVSKTSALVALAIAAPDLALEAARSGLVPLLPIAGGYGLQSAPSVLTDHRNPRRARSTLTRSVPPHGVQTAALQACCRLARVAAPASPEVDRAIAAALRSEAAPLVATAMRELTELEALGADVRPHRWRSDPDASVRAAARDLEHARARRRRES